MYKVNLVLPNDILGLDNLVSIQTEGDKLHIICEDFDRTFEKSEIVGLSVLPEAEIQKVPWYDLYTKCEHFRAILTDDDIYGHPSYEYMCDDRHIIDYTCKRCIENNLGKFKQKE